MKEVVVEESATPPPPPTRFASSLWTFWDEPGKKRGKKMYRLTNKESNFPSFLLRKKITDTKNPKRTKRVSEKEVQTAAKLGMNHCAHELPAKKNGGELASGFGRPQRK
ncbi:hypothetical protein RUM43_002415 [Polyplax serrata]|uniref:Uncharacterized protein n=1 Tax=Polyplax serrata TaxID=468196 RepID=A0AAN8P289_POLSC